MHAACLQRKSAAEGGLLTLGADQDTRAPCQGDIARAAPPLPRAHAA